MLARGPVTYSFGHPLNPSRSSVLRPQNFSASGPILPLDKLPKIVYTILMLTYSPQSPRACALQMPNRPPEKTFITSCRPQDSPVVHKTLCHAQNKAHPNAQSSPSRTPSISPKPSPPIHLRRQVGNMVPSSLRVFRDLIIFRENRRKCASIRSARAVPSPVPHFSVQFFCPHPCRFLSPPDLTPIRGRSKELR